MREAFLAKNADVLLVWEQYAKGKRKVEEAERRKEELGVKLEAAKAEVGRQGALVGNLQEEKVEVEVEVKAVRAERDRILQVELQEAQGSSWALEESSKRHW